MKNNAITLDLDPDAGLSARTGERILEFSSENGGGLLAFRPVDGGIIVTAYRFSSSARLIATDGVALYRTEGEGRNARAVFAEAELAASTGQAGNPLPDKPRSRNRPRTAYVTVESAPEPEPEPAATPARQALIRRLLTVPCSECPATSGESCINDGQREITALSDSQCMHSSRLIAAIAAEKAKLAEVTEAFNGSSPPPAALGEYAEQKGNAR